MNGANNIPGNAVVPTLTFGQALNALKTGKNVARLGWNGKGLHLELINPAKYSEATMPYVCLVYPINPKHPVYPNGGRVPWTPSQTDMLASDWIEV